MAASTGVIYGNYSLMFTDTTGEVWQTMPIDIFATCDAVINALETLPNNVIPTGSVLCYKPEFLFHTNLVTTTTNGVNQVTYNPTVYVADTNVGQSIAVATGQSGGVNYAGASTANGYPYGFEEVEPIYDLNMNIITKYTLAFPGNPGAIPQLSVNKYLDGARPTLFTTDATNTLNWSIYPNGFIGEQVDMVPDECSGVLVTLATGSTTHTLAGLDAVSLKRLKICLGDSDGIVATNVEVYNWDYGNTWNPHLIKLVDATQDISTEYIRADGTTYKIPDAYARNPGSATGTATLGGSGSTGNSGVYQDSVLYDYPITKLCSNQKGWQFYKNTASLMTGSNVYNPANYNSGWCHNINPPGFFAVIWWGVLPGSGSQGTALAFNIFTRAAQDYGTTTKFHVFTTTGVLQRVSADAHMFTASGTMTSTVRTNTYFSNTVYMSNATSTYSNYFGGIDCETNYASPPMASNIILNGAKDCLNKNDLVMFLNVGHDTAAKYTTANMAAWTTVTDTTTTGLTQDYSGDATTAPTSLSLNSNPVYPNIYTVKKIGRDDKNNLKNGVWGWNTKTNSEKMRHQIVLDYGMNARYMYNGGVSDTRDTTAAVFKFYAPSNAYNYADECSNRGLCDNAQGICQCFAGFTGDACDQINALAL